jgi:hypothetical protein
MVLAPAFSTATVNPFEKSVSAFAMVSPVHHNIFLCGMAAVALSPSSSLAAGKHFN